MGSPKVLSNHWKGRVFGTHKPYRSGTVILSGLSTGWFGCRCHLENLYQVKLRVMFDVMLVKPYSPLQDPPLGWEQGIELVPMFSSFIS